MRRILLNSLVVTIATLLAGSVAALGQTVDFTVGDCKVVAQAMSLNIFCISINAKGEAASVRSVFLAPGLTPVAGVATISSSGDRRTIATAAGQLRIDRVAGTCSLVDPHGVVLMPPAPIVGARKQGLAVCIGWPQDRPFAIYGCGNGADSLVQKEVHTRVGNGVAVQPFFWCANGFASFVLGNDDDAPAQCDGHVDSGSVTWSVPGNAADLYLIIAPTLLDATRGLLALTGRPPVPPRWTFGYMQSRWGWVDRAYIDDTLHQFEQRKLPVDAFIFDFEWYTTSPDYEVKPEGLDGFSDFGWNSKLFPSPAEQIKNLHDAGVHFVGIRKPRLGNRQTLEMVRGKGWGFQSQSKVDARAMRFANPDARTWYANQLEPLLKTGIDGWWNDEGEFTYSNYLYWNMAERAALDAVNPAARLWTINRAFQPGLSRMGAAAWTGDIQSSWKDFQRTPTALLNWSLAGMPYGACDIGGFSGEVTPELLVRWMQAGTFFPVMRTHSELSVKPHFPWLFGDEAEAAMRKTLQLRYRLIPLLYSLAHETHETGNPIMRPLFLYYPNDPQTADLSSEWLIGRDLLAAPILQEGERRTIYLPDDTWYDFATGEKLSGDREFERTAATDEVPAYVRAGAILPLGPLVLHTSQLDGGQPLDLQIYAGRDGEFTLAEDDGSTTAYQNGAVRKTAFHWDDSAGALSWTRSGKYDGNDCFRSVRITLYDGHPARPAVLQELSATGRVVLAR